MNSPIKRQGLYVGQDRVYEIVSKMICLFVIEIFMLCISSYANAKTVT